MIQNTFPTKFMKKINQVDEYDSRWDLERERQLGLRALHCVVGPHPMK